MLRTGNFKTIVQSSQVKMEKIESLATVLSAIEPGKNAQHYKSHLGPRLARLKNLSSENGLLLRGIANGVKAVQERLLVLENREAQVGAYGRQGNALAFEEQSAAREETF